MTETEELQIGNRPQKVGSEQGSRGEGFCREPPGGAPNRKGLVASEGAGSAFTSEPPQRSVTLFGEEEQWSARAVGLSGRGEKSEICDDAEAGLRDVLLRILVTQAVTVALLLVGLLAVRLFTPTVFDTVRVWYGEHFLTETSVDEVLNAGYEGDDGPENQNGADGGA